MPFPNSEKLASCDRGTASIRGGIRFGVSIAAVFSLFASAGALVGVSRAGERFNEAGTVWLLAMLFYLSAGVIGGTIWGLLRPYQHRCWGKYLSAYLILLLVYGGGSATLLPLLEDEPVPVRKLFALWGVICLFLAPLYVRITRDWEVDLPPLQSDT